MHEFILFFGINLLLSLMLINISKSHTIPIKRDNSGRTFGISNREIISVPVYSIILLYFIRKCVFDISIIYMALIYMIITAILIHVIFGVRTMLNYKLGLSKKPNGTGIAPYGNY